MSRLARGEIDLAVCHPDIEEVLGLCLTATEYTNGYFSAFPYGKLDPTGLVKAWAIQGASEVLRAAGSRHHAVNGGGDVQMTGDDSSAPWRVGIVDPSSRERLIAVAVCQRGGVATSGTAERGHHIVNPRDGQRAQHFASVSITAPTVLEADVLATAAFARGPSAVDWIGRLDDVEGFFVAPDGEIQMTTGFPAA
jgi:thiamine biosynthesis lipoprotein